jgi:hypothetical protein
MLDEAKKYDSKIVKGAPSTAEMVKILYESRHKDLIVFDDADSVVKNPNSANILKSALDDTVGEANNGVRYVYPPKLTKEVMDTYDLDGPGGDSFSFSASIVIITNLTKVADPALWTRLYKAPIFMTKTDIIEKIKETTDPSVFGCTDEQGSQVADFMVALVANGDFHVDSAKLSYRFFKQGLTFIKHFPADWKGKVMRALGIGVRTSLPKDG